MVNIRDKIKETVNFIKTCFSDQQPTQSGALVGSNDDLLTEIFLRLPVKSIFRFKSVCKHWRWLLSGRHFTLSYDNLSKSHGLFSHDMHIPFDVENPCPRPFRRRDVCFDPCGIKIMQSCNGLLLCCSKQGYESDCKYYVFNPSTKQFAIIPSVPEGDSASGIYHFMALAFHHTECAHYKVICIRSVDSSPHWFRIRIYSSETRKWKIFNESFSAHVMLFSKGFVYWNGAIHWPPGYETHLYFKIEAEQLRTFPFPVEMTPSETSTRYFGESRGHLQLIVTNCGVDAALHFNVYEMLSDHSGWFAKHRVQLDEFPAAFPELVFCIPGFYYYVEVIDVVRGEKEEDTYLVLKVCKKIIKYNVYRKTFQQILSFRKDLCFGWYEAHRNITTCSSF